MIEWLNRTLYADVTWLNLIIAFIIFQVSLIFSKIITVQLRRTIKDKMKKEHLEMITKLVCYGIMVIAVL